MNRCVVVSRTITNDGMVLPTDIRNSQKVTDVASQSCNTLTSQSTKMALVPLENRIEQTDRIGRVAAL